MKPAAETVNKGIKILIIEDEGDICFLLNIMLKKDDVEISHANTLAQASVFLSEETPDAVILDNRMPDGLGMDYIKEIKEKYPSVKILMISGNTSSADEEKALSNGADLFLGKPFTKNQMQTSLEGLLNYNFV